MSRFNQRGQRRGGGSGDRAGRRKSAPSGPPPEPLHPTENPPEVETFAEFELIPEVQEAISEMGIVKPTPIQALAIGPVLNGKDVIAKAETGTGKTLAFGAPMISKIDPDRSSVLGLVLCPTRELADQVKVVLEKLGEPRGIKCALIVGGEPAGPQVAALQAGAQVVVGTPGRVIDLYEQKFLSFPWTEFVVLDEADEMFEIGFVDDVKKIMRFTPDERQTLLFSATFPPALLRLARDHTNDPAEIATASGVKTVDNIEQVYIRVDTDERALALIRMIERSKPEDVFLVFCERRTDVERLMRRLERLPFSVKALHGGYDQSARFRVMSAFRTGEVKALVATDVASRGLDVNHVTRVVNFSPPRSITDYTHRIGRTGRAGREGHAVTLVAPEALVRWNAILKEATWDIPEVDAPGSRFAPPARERSDEDRPRRRDRERNDNRDREQQQEPERRPERQRDAESERRPERQRQAESERRPERQRQAESEQRPERQRQAESEQRPERQRQAGPVESRPRPVRQRAERMDAPVELPQNGNLRQRDPNDPPRRVRLTREMRERLDETQGEAPRSSRPNRGSRSSRQESQREGRRDSQRDSQRDSDEPRRERARPTRNRDQDRDEARPQRDRRPRRDRDESRDRAEGRARDKGPDRDVGRDRNRDRNRDRGDQKGTSQAAPQAPRPPASGGGFGSGL